MTKKQRKTIKLLRKQIKIINQTNKIRIQQKERNIKILIKDVDKLMKYFRNPICPKCESIVIIKQGLRKTGKGQVQRFSCKNCGFRFSQYYIDYRMRNNQEIILKALALRKKGKTLAQISNELGNKVSRQTVHNWIKTFQKPEKIIVTKFKQNNQYKPYIRKMLIKV